MTEQWLDYRFRRPELLLEALTHPSLGKKNNQRLEFLGDSVLGAVVARLLFELFPHENEGNLARRHAALVCGTTLARLAREIGLGERLEIAASEASSGGRKNPTNLEDAMEALIGALFVDGGYAAAESFIVPRWRGLARSTIIPPKDAKTSLQEWAQGRGMPVPSYTLQHHCGPAHAPQFTIEVALPGYAPVSATASTKRAAEQQAAKALLLQVTK